MQTSANRLKKAVADSLISIFKPGTSKEEARNTRNQDVRKALGAKGATTEELKKLPVLPSPYIHSYSTYYQYLAICQQYAAWLAKHHPDTQKLAYALRKGYAREYIQGMIDRDLAASTIARTTAALAKLYRCNANDIHDNRPERSYTNFIRSRNYSEAQFQKDIDKYGVIAELCRMTGVREIELEHLYPECFQEDTDGKLHLHLDGRKQHTKGGKSRDTVILDRHQQRLREILADFEAGKLICPKAPSHLDIHGIRSLYAMDYYNEVARPIGEIPAAERIPLKRAKIDNKRPGQKRISAPAVYQRQSDGKKFDRKALLIVTRSLGHNREDVMVHSYLR